MNQIKTLMLAVACMAGGSAVQAQEVARTVVVEHFTNTYCSVCASRNPGFYANLWAQPGILHIAYHPSAPYPSCTLNQHNVTENNDRTNYYGVYGSTPRLVIQGDVVAASANYSDAAIFAAASGQTSPFAMSVSVSAAGSDSVRIMVTVKKVAASSLTSVSLYGALVEDTLFFSAPNGELRSYDVFRKSLWSSGLFGITLPAGVGDSVVFTQKHKLHGDWIAGAMYAMAMMQDGSKDILQAARSGTLPALAGMPVMAAATQPTIKPNPAAGYITLTGVPAYPCRITIFDVTGRRHRDAVVERPGTNIPISDLPAGNYLLYIDRSAVALPFTRN